MANKYSNNLYKLIKSLSKAEKRYFKLFVSRHTANNAINNYQLLFDAIDKQEEFNEEKIKKKLKGNLFLKKFSIAKARLYDTILKSLDAYYSEKSVDQQIRNELHYIEILYNRSLYNQCERRINSAKKKAVKHEKKLLLAEIIGWEKKLIEKDNYLSLTQNQLKTLLQEEKENVNDILLNNNLWEIKSELFQYINTKGRVRTEEEVEILKNRIEVKLSKISIPKHQIKLQYLNLHIKGAFYFATYNYKKSLLNVIETMNLINNNPLEFKGEPNILFSELNNAVYLAIKLNKIVEAKMYYASLKSLFLKISIDASNDLVLKLKSSLISLELTLARISCNIKNIDTVLVKAINFIGTNKHKLNQNRLAYLYYNISTLYFLKEDYSTALKWINSLLNNINIDKTQEIYSFAKIFNLVIHLELDNKELILYTIKSTKRFLQTRNKIFKFETLMLSFFKKIGLQKNIFDTFEYYEKLKLDFLRINTNMYEQIPFEYFDYIAWTESKLAKKPIHQVSTSKIDFLI